MKNLNLFFAVLFFAVLSISLNGQSRDISDFSKLKVSTSVSVMLIKSNSPRIEYKMIKGSDSDLITEIKGKTLVVKTKSKFGGWNNAQAKVKVYYTSLDEISVSAGATVKCEEAIVSDEIELSVSSGSTAHLEIETNDLDADASSGATLKLSGRSEKASYDASSGSTLNAGMVICNHVKADVSSGATIKAHADKTLKADASSGGSIRYSGDADDSHIDRGWSGEIRKM